jgi:TetR/AcrR family transcriptional repressor of nem operon
MAVNSVSELVGVNPVLGPVLENAFLNNIKCFEALLEESIRQGLLPENTDAHSLALALQNTLMGLNTMSQLVKSEPELWSATRVTLEALNVYRELQY